MAKQRFCVFRLFVKKKSLNKKDGFTLVELSIVLVIIGLIAGGILMGISLIESAQIHQTVSRITAYKTAFNTFRIKYNGIPGDMPNAYEIWGSEVGCINAIVSDVQRTGCNGNNDGFITDYAASGEDLRGVQFLAASGLIDGKYTGVIAASGNARQIGVNIYSAGINNAALWMNRYSTGNFGRTGNNLFLAKEGAVYPGGAALTPKQASIIDTKIDDGNPTTGLISPDASQSTCYSGTSYILTSNSVTCSLFIFIP